MRSALSGLEQNQKILASLDALVRQHPDDAQVYFQRGCFRARPANRGDKGALEAAIADFTRALDRAPGHLEARFWRGCLAAQIRNRDAAIADLSWVIEHDPDRAAALIVRGRVFAERGEFDRAIADLDRGATLGPGKGEYSMLIDRGWCYAAKGQHDRAIADFTRAIERFTVTDTWVYRERAKSFWATEDLERALDDLDEALQLRPDDLSVHLLRADLLMEMGDHEALTREADQLRKLLPNHPGPHFLHSVASWLAACDRDSELAEIIRDAAWAERVLPCAPAPHLIHTLAASMTGMGRKAALADMDRCLALEPDISFGYACRAIFNAHEGEFARMFRDLALLVLKFDRRQYHPFASIDWTNRCFMVGIYITGPNRKPSANPRAPVAEIGGKCIDMGCQQLLAAAFGSRR